ncbi:MAG: C40 family peptidase [Clostridia bacterium]|nr:C40 family peptidase [Clostridia bacterium]
MKRKFIYLVVAILILQVVGVGCSSQNTGNGSEGLKEASKPSSEEAKPKEPERVVQSTQAAEEVIEEGEAANTGVVTGTVVDVFREADKKSERVTQAIYNQGIEILDKKENWIKARVVDGYTGWIESKFVDTNCSSIKDDGFKYKLVVIEKLAKVEVMGEGKEGSRQLVMGAELYSFGKAERGYEVVLPGEKKGWIEEKSVMELLPDEHIPKTSAGEFVLTLEKFKATPYLWGGVSSWEGLDCSGLTYICSRINGVDLPRDADQQIKVGRKILESKEQLESGDLVFFSTNTDLKDVSHVGVFIGDGRFIHASKSNGKVIVSKLSESYFQKRLVGVRRLF